MDIWQLATSWEGGRRKEGGGSSRMRRIIRIYQYKLCVKTQMLRIREEGGIKDSYIYCSFDSMSVLLISTATDSFVVSVLFICNFLYQFPSLNSSNVYTNFLWGTFLTHPCPKTSNHPVHYILCVFLTCLCNHHP